MDLNFACQNKKIKMNQNRGVICTRIEFEFDLQEILYEITNLKIKQILIVNFSNFVNMTMYYKAAMQLNILSNYYHFRYNISHV